jgi:hypothetical protein
MNEKHSHQNPQYKRNQSMHEQCKNHMFYHVFVKTSDGQQVEGIITDLDKKNVYMLVPQDMMPVNESEQNQPEQQQGQMTQGSSDQSGQQMLQQGGQESRQNNQRQWDGGPRYRRFYRQIFPLATLTALALYPYYYPPYPYPYNPYAPYPYYPYTY